MKKKDSAGRLKNLPSLVWPNAITKKIPGSKLLKSGDDNQRGEEYNYRPWKNYRLRTLYRLLKFGPTEPSKLNITTTKRVHR